MATTEILVKDGTPIVWANTGEFVATLSGFTRTHQIDLDGLDDTKARQGAKADLTATRAGGYAVRVGIEFDVAPTAGEAVYFYWSASNSATAGTGNDGGCTGADAAYKDGDEAEWVKQLTLMGVLVVTADLATVVQYGTINTYFRPPQRYGQPVVWNEAGQAFEGDAVEMFIALIPTIDEFQA